jgi:O-antigen/teichoic acid export membrane protein
VVLLQDPILRLLGGEEAAESAGTVLILAAIGQAVYGAVFWHTTLLYAARRAAAVSTTTMATALVQIALVALLVPEHGATGAAVALVIGRVSNGAILAVMALQTLRVPQTPQPAT